MQEHLQEQPIDTAAYQGTLTWHLFATDSFHPLAAAGLCKDKDVWLQEEVLSTAIYHLWGKRRNK